MTIKYGEMAGELYFQFIIKILENINTNVNK